MNYTFNSKVRKKQKIGIYRLKINKLLIIFTTKYKITKLLSARGQEWLRKQGKLEWTCLHFLFQLIDPITLDLESTITPKSSCACARYIYQGKRLETSRIAELKERQGIWTWNLSLPTHTLLTSLPRADFLPQPRPPPLSGRALLQRLQQKLQSAELESEQLQTSRGGPCVPPGCPLAGFPIPLTCLLTARWAAWYLQVPLPTGAGFSHTQESLQRSRTSRPPGRGREIALVNTAELKYRGSHLTLTRRRRFRTS